MLIFIFYVIQQLPDSMPSLYSFYLLSFLPLPHLPSHSLLLRQMRVHRTFRRVNASERDFDISLALLVSFFCRKPLSIVFWGTSYLYIMYIPICLSYSGQLSILEEASPARKWGNKYIKVKQLNNSRNIRTNV